MRPEEIAAWAALARDVLLPLAGLIVALMLKRKYGIEVDMKNREKLQSIALDAVAYAEQMGRSRHHSTDNTAEGKKDAAMEYASPQVKPGEQKQVAKQIEAELGKLTSGITPLQQTTVPIVSAGPV